MRKNTRMQNSLNNYNNIYEYNYDPLSTIALRKMLRMEQISRKSHRSPAEADMRFGAIRRILEHRGSNKEIMQRAVAISPLDRPRAYD